VLGVKGYRLWCTDLHPPKFIISRDVKFNELTMLYSSKEVRDVGKENNIKRYAQADIVSFALFVIYREAK